jgi:hypothetical protein
MVTAVSLLETMFASWMGILFPLSSSPKRTFQPNSMARAVKEDYKNGDLLKIGLEYFSSRLKAK